MIDRVADLLAKLVTEETRRLGEYHLTHGPTIGEMYEGLTREILNTAIPRELSLDVVKGFVTDESGILSPEIDCMIVQGSGETIPYTNKYKWHVRDVIAVFEVKKTLYSGELVDSYCKLRAVLERFSRYVSAETGGARFDISSARRTFEQMTGIAAPPHREAAAHLGFPEELVYHTLVIERVSPVRIVLGYDGFASEAALREAFIEFLAGNQRSYGFGVMSLPQLCISGRFSLVKTNGEPYVTLLRNGWWPVITSSRANPVRLLLEFIWTRLERSFGVGGLWGEDLQIEGLNPLLLAKAGEADGRQGWQYEYVPSEEQTLARLPAVTDWEPTTVDESQFVVLNCLCAGQKVLTTDPRLLSYLASKGIEMSVFIAGLRETGLIAMEGSRMKLTTEGMGCAILPDGRFVAGENSTGRLSRWVARQAPSDSA